MTEYTKDIKPIGYSGPKFSPPTGNNVGADVVSALSTGLEIYGGIQNKKRQANLDKMVGDLSSYEAELAQNDISKNERLRLVDKMIREKGLDASSSSQLRTAFAQKRGSFVQRDIVAEADKAEAQREHELNSEFNAALSNAPQLFSKYKRNEDGDYSREVKIAVVSDFEDYRIRGYQRAKENEKANQLLAQGGEQAIEGVVLASNAISGDIKDIFNPTSAGIVQTLSNLDLATDEGVALAEETLSNARNTFRVATSTIETRYNSLIEAQSDTGIRKMLQENRDASLKQMERIQATLSDPDLSKMEKRVQNIKLIESGMKLSGLDNYGLIATLEQIAPESSRFIVQRLVSQYPDIIDAATKEMAQSILTQVDPVMAATKFGSDFERYMDTGDTEKANDLVLRTFYGYARDTITNMPVRDLTSGEVDKISGGLLGIMQEAATTDDPEQIKEATKLLNSPNFQTFFEQLPEDRKAPMGRFISSFNQDILIDATDGLFTKIGGAVKAKDANITYNADSGKFEIESTRSLQAQPTGGAGLEFVPSSSYAPERAIKRFVDEANGSLEMIRKNAQYDPITQNSKELIDTMVAEKLPKDIKVKGKLDVFTAEESSVASTAQAKETQEKMRSNIDILENLGREIDKLGGDVTLKSLKPEDLQRLLNVSQGI